MKIFKSIWFYITLSIIIVICAIGIGISYNSNNTIKVNINSDSNSLGCLSVNITPVEGASEYSFNGGKTWQKSNYGVFYTNGKHEILARDSYGKTIASKMYNVNNIESGYPTIKLDFDKKISNTDKESLLEDVHASNGVFDISKKLRANVISETDEYAIVKYSVTNDNRAETSLIAKLEKNKKDNTINDDISFQMNNYSCIEGKNIKTNIKYEDVKIKSYYTTDNKIATVEQINETCEKCIAINIKCLKTGTTSLIAINENNKKIESNIKVESNVGAVSFNKSEYTCTEGDKLYATITATNPVNAIVKSYSSSNTSIASIEKNPNVAKCPNCLAIIINCNKVGTTTLKTTSSTGAVGTANVKVNSKKIGTINYTQSTYKCTEGETIDATIKTDNENTRVVSYSSNNTSVATIAKHPTLTAKCPNCVITQIKCLKSGTATLSASSSTGAKTTSTLNVVKKETPSVGTISFDSSSYSCTEGESKRVVITSTSEIVSYQSSNGNVAIIAKDANVTPRCPNCYAALITCKKKGSATLTVQSKTGAKKTTNVTVQEVPETLYFDHTTYTCTEGTTIGATITSSAGIKSYTTSNSAIATIAKDPNLQPRCPNCTAAIITCKAKGTVSVGVVSNKGTTKTASVTVQENPETLYFDNTTYTCTEGTTIGATITSSAGIKSYTTSNSTIATIAKDPNLQPRCPNCTAAIITCKAKGTVSVGVVSNKGTTKTASVTVNESNEVLRFDNTSYTCTEGKSLVVTITSTKGVASYTTSNSAIATIEKHPNLQPRCLNCIAGLITCKKQGSVTVGIVSNTGKRSSVPVTVTK